MNNFRIEVDADGIAVVTFDAPGKRMNTLNGAVFDELEQVIQRIREDGAIKGAVLRSGKSTGFCAGADLPDVTHVLDSLPTDPVERKRAAVGFGHDFHRRARALETSGKPFVAVIEGLALGGGLELALCCHYRVASDDAAIQLGLPEVKVGLLPGGGGTQRLPRLIGYRTGARMILSGESVGPKRAYELGFIDALAAPGQALDTAKAWLRSQPLAQQPWDRADFRVNDGPETVEGAAIATALNAQVRRETFGNYPAQQYILAALYEGLRLPIDTALRVEARMFAETLLSTEAKAMVRSLFVSMQQLTKGVNRPTGYPRFDVKMAAVLGAGMMGAGIAHAQALAGIDTVLIDREPQLAERGVTHARTLLENSVARGTLTQERATATLARIEPTTDYERLRGADLVVEAVFENLELKAQVTARAEALLGDAAVFGSNTSTLPITQLAEASARPKNFIGLHFFSPVDRMQLVEIIVGEQTSEETLAKAVDYVLKIRKTPIVVRDRRGFYTSRCFSSYLNEGVELFAEGIAPAIIDNLGRATGMPRGPLELADDVAIDLVLKIGRETRAALGADYRPRAADRFSEVLVEQHGRSGRKNGKGFYDYPEHGKKSLWSGLRELVPVKTAEASSALTTEIKRRLLYIQALEAARCFEEGVISQPRDADVGSILGWGYARWSGGVISLIDGIGTTTFVGQCDVLADRHGERFRPGALLREMAARNESFYRRYSA